MLRTAETGALSAKERLSELVLMPGWKDVIDQILSLAVASKQILLTSRTLNETDRAYHLGQLSSLYSFLKLLSKQTGSPVSNKIHEYFTGAQSND